MPSPSEENGTKIIIKNLTLDMSIGVHDFEKEKPQRVIVSIEAVLVSDGPWLSDSIGETMNYETIVTGIQDLAKQGHVNLLETFAERIAALCLKEPAIRNVSVTVEKPDIFPYTDSVAVTLYRKNR